MIAFVAAVVSLIAAFAAVGTTIPLFTVYRVEDGFSSADIALAVVAYSIGTIATLLVLGRLSNQVGRRLTALAALLLAIAGCAVLLDVHAAGSLIVGRLLMGLGAGMASSSLSAYVVDTAPARPAWLASVASSQTVMLGLAVGAVGAGALVEFGPWPRQLPLLVVMLLLAVSCALILSSPEIVARAPFAWGSLRPSVRVPNRVKRLLPVATAVILPTWATGAFYQAFVPALVADRLHTGSPLVLGLVFAAYMAPSAVGATLAHRFRPAVAQRIGMAAFLVGWVGIVTADATGGLALFFAATVVAGVGQGVAISAVTRGLLFGSTVVERAPIFAVVYLLSYSGATIPSLIAGRLSTVVPVPVIAVAYGIFALLGAAYTFSAAKDPLEEEVSRPRSSRYA